MPLINAGTSATITLGASQTVSITPDPAETAVVNITRNGVLIGNTFISAPRSLGPYQAGDVMTITAIRGNVDYDVVASPVSGDEVATWADLPAAASVPVGRTYTVLDTGWRVYSDGTNWRPANGRLQIAQRNGTLSSPISTLTGVTSANFTLPITPTLLAGMVVPHSRVRCDVRVRRTTAAASATVAVRLGTSNSTSDALVCGLFTGASANVDANPFCAAEFGTSGTSFLASGISALNAATSSAVNDRTGNVDWTAAMHVSIGVSGANASDSFSLLSYAVWLEA